MRFAFEPDQDVAMRERPFRKHYKSAQPCLRHGATPTRYTNTQNCVDCSRDYRRKKPSAIIS